MHTDTDAARKLMLRYYDESAGVVSVAARLAGMDRSDFCKCHRQLGLANDLERIRNRLEQLFGYREFRKGRLDIHSPWAKARAQANGV